MTPFNEADEMIKLLDRCMWFKQKDASFYTHTRNPGHSFGLQGTKFIHFKGNDLNQHEPIFVGFGLNALRQHLQEFHGWDQLPWNKKKKASKKKAA